MEDLLARVWGNLLGRLGGPLTFRLILQPLVAALFAIRAGMRDAREGRSPYFWAIFTGQVHRGELLREGWDHVGKIFVVAVTIDFVYQILELRWFYPVEALIVAAILALLPYVLIHGPPFAQKMSEVMYDG